MSYFTTAANIEALALAIIPAPPAGASAEQIAAMTAARQNLKDHFLTELGNFINNGLNSVFTAGVPVPQDGGAALQTAWKAETST